MAISGIIVKVQLGLLDEVKAVLDSMDNISVEAVSPNKEIVAVMESKSLDDMKKECFALEKIAGVIGVYPSFVTTEDEIKE
ncbi:MAG: chaperone NapD [Selenomonadaceae bacterium]|nr:chaperone NapD [Selenomonadaceae bacterium]